MVKHCIVTGIEITPDNDSKAHVIPSALGGRLKPLGILSSEGNGLLGDKIDLPLIEAFQSLMNRLDGSRDRGDNQPSRMTDESGKAYVFTFGEPLALAKPEYEETVVGETTKISIKARTLKEARTLLGRIKAKYPKFDIDEAMKHAVFQHAWSGNELHEAFQIGPDVLFPAAFVAASIFSAYHDLAVHPLLRAYVTGFDPEHPELPPDTFYFIPPKPWATSTAQVAHILALCGDAKSGQQLVYVELFNLVKVAVLLPYNGNADIRHTYGIDVLSGVQVPVQINEQALMAVPWQATHQLGDRELYADTARQFRRLVTIALDRETAAGIAKVIERALGPVDGRRLTPNDFANVVAEVVAYTKQAWSDPSYLPDHRQDQVSRFKELCRNLESMVPPASRAEFRRLIVPHIESLVAAAKGD